MASLKELCSGLSDLEIIDLSLGDVQYFGCLYDRYEERMLRYINKISGLPREEAEDVLQEAFIRIWTNINGFDRSFPFKSWLYRIVHNLTVSQWRKNSTRAKQQVVLENQTSPYLGAEAMEDFEEINQDHKKRIQKALSSLKTNYREIIILRFFENMKYEEISDILKIPEGTVATRINRAKKQLRKELGGLSFFDQN